MPHTIYALLRSSISHPSPPRGKERLARTHVAAQDLRMFALRGPSCERPVLRCRRDAIVVRVIGSFPAIFGGFQIWPNRRLMPGRWLATIYYASICSVSKRNRFFLPADNIPFEIGMNFVVFNCISHTR